MLLKQVLFLTKFLALHPSKNSERMVSFSCTLKSSSKTKRSYFVLKLSKTFPDRKDIPQIEEGDSSHRQAI